MWEPCTILVTATEQVRLADRQSLSFQTPPILCMYVYVYFTCRTGPVMEFNSNSTEMREFIYLEGRRKWRKIKQLPLVPSTLWSALSGPACKSLCPILEIQSQGKGKYGLPQLVTKVLGTCLTASRLLCHLLCL